MRQVLIRVARTFAQAFIGTLLTMGVLSGVTETGVLPGWPVWQQLFVSAAAAGVIAVLAFAQNWLEETRPVTYDRG